MIVFASIPTVATHAGERGWAVPGRAITDLGVSPLCTIGVNLGIFHSIGL